MRRLDVYQYETYEEVMETIDRTILEDKKIRITAINPEKLAYALKNSDFSKIIDKSDVNIPDGIGIIWGALFKNKHIKSRVTGIDLFSRICLEYNNKNIRIFMFGAAPNVAKRARDNLLDLNPNINIVGHEHGYLNNYEELITRINSLKVNILFVALGSPKQEIWIDKYFEKIEVNVLMGVGGVFDVISKNKNRAPFIFRKLGFEWFYRMLTDKQRRWRIRNIVYYVLNIHSFNFININEKFKRQGK